MIAPYGERRGSSEVDHIELRLTLLRRPVVQQNGVVAIVIARDT